MKRTLLLLLVVLSIGLLLSCYSSPSNANNTVTSGIADRAFVTQNVPNAGSGIDVVDVQTDLLSLTHIIPAGNTPGMMVVTPNRNQTLVFSGDGTQNSDNLFSLINNASEQNAVQVRLPGRTQSFVVSPDSNFAYVAIPTAPVVGQSQGAIKLINLATGNVNAEVDIPSVRYLAINHSGTHLLAFSDNSDSLAIVTPSNIGTGQPVVTFVAGFNRPVQGFFSTDDNTAFIVNCGAECGGTQDLTHAAGVQTLDLTTNTAGSPLFACAPGETNQCAATTATIVGTTMYLAGTPFQNGLASQPCTGQQTQATTCGIVTAVDLPTMTVINTAPVIITDGYHDHIAMGANGQLFVGAHACTEISGSETRGCLSIFNTNSGAVVIPPSAGDVTGLQPIANRFVVYLVQGGELQIYDTSTDKLQSRQVDISGVAVDVVTVDH